MAQDLFFIPLNDDVAQTFPREIVLGILSKGASQPVTDFYCAYPDGSHGEASGIDHEDDGPLTHLGFGHFGGRIMMERIFEVANALEVFLCWSDVDETSPGACVTRAERMDRVRSEAKDGLRCVVVQDASHLNQLVKGVTFEEIGW